VKKIKSISGIKTVTLTTNGTLLSEKLDSLVDSGVDGINISLDTLDRKKFLELTGSDSLDKTLAAINACAEKGISAKINTVVLRNFNEDEVCQIAALARDSKVDVRFIELMPIGLGKVFESVPQNEVEAALEREFGSMTESSGKRGNGPASYYTLVGFKGKIGFIGSKSHKFCDSCNRVRLTGDGFLKQCLHFDQGTDLKTPLRNGASRDELEKLVASCIQEKPEGHRFGEDVSHGEKRIMAKIGG
ncbi:MAG: radical SAM protein, partial [Spirochaetaceae bacterium]|nr:radical SAM protein [Spirochaetaceae bacterium]